MGATLGRPAAGLRLGTAVDIGYRFELNRFLLGLGGLLGVAAPVSAENQWYDGRVTSRNIKVVFFGAAMLELGFCWSWASTSSAS